MMDTMITDDTVRMDCIYIDMIACVRRLYTSVGIADTMVVVVDDTWRGHVPRTVKVVRVTERVRRIFTPVGTADPVVTVVLNITKEINYIASIGITRSRRFLFP